MIEKFKLSGQYTPKNFLDSYRSSMELELRNYNMLEYNMFKQAQISFPDDNTLHVILPDSVVAREKSEILLEYFHKVFCERCGMDLKVELDYVETQETKYRKNAAVQIRQEVENVIRNAGIVQKKTGKNRRKQQREEAKKGTATDKKEEKKSPVREQKTFEKKGKKGEFGGGFRRDSNPDVVYGRDFEERRLYYPGIHTGEMGEVIVRGQVMDVEAREIRNEKNDSFIFRLRTFTDSIVVKMF